MRTLQQAIAARRRAASDRGNSAAAAIHCKRIGRKKIPDAGAQKTGFYPDLEDELSAEIVERDGPVVGEILDIEQLVSLGLQAETLVEHDIDSGTD